MVIGEDAVLGLKIYQVIVVCFYFMYGARFNQKIDFFSCTHIIRNFRLQIKQDST